MSPAFLSKFRGGSGDLIFIFALDMMEAMNMEQKKYIIRGLAVVVIIGLIGFFAFQQSTTQKNDKNNPSVSAENSTLPAPVDPKSIGKIIDDKKMGKQYMSNQVIVEFDPSLTEQASVDIIESVGGKMQQRFTLAPLFLVQVEDPGDGSHLQEVIKKLNSTQGVKKAEPNYLTTTTQ